MKNLMILLLLISNVLFAQENRELQILIKKREIIKTHIHSLQDSLKYVETSIETVKSKQFLSLVDESSLVAKCRDGGKLKKTPSPLENPFAILNQNTNLIILDYTEGYFGVLAGSIYGYISDVWVISDSTIKKYIEAKNIENERLKQLAEEKGKMKEAKERKLLEQKYIKQYGKVIYEKLKNGYYWISMTAEMAIISIGYPDDINRTVGSWGVHEQWIYKSKDTYLYFENGILKSYQN